MSRRLEHLEQQRSQSPASALPRARFAILGGIAAVVAGALYLIAVRGEALLLDLSALAGNVWCF